MKILVTGAAGFIGYHLCKVLLTGNNHVIALDNVNDYYNVNLKYDRLKQLGIPKEKATVFGAPVHIEHRSSSLTFIRMDLQDFEGLQQVFETYKPEVICHLAAQAGVRYSLQNPRAYIDNNLIGFFNVLECSKNENVKHFVYASSSSVYGNNESIPFKATDSVDHPVSLYAATKKSNELMAHTYSHLYNLPTTGLRFFTVYGPWGRPDMAMYLFTSSIIKGEPIKVFNEGKLERDFTYVDDIVQGVLKVLSDDISKRGEKYRIYNIGNNKSVKLLDFIHEIERHVGRKAQKELMPMQAGDVERTWANVDALMNDYHYAPKTTIDEGIKKYVEWYKGYYLA